MWSTIIHNACVMECAIFFRWIPAVASWLFIWEAEDTNTQQVIAR